VSRTRLGHRSPSRPLRRHVVPGAVGALSTLLLAVGLLLAIPVTAATAATPVIAAARGQRPVPTHWQLIGHRGFPRAGFTEDLLPSLNVARRVGAPAVETDMRIAADGVILINHDDDLARTTTCRGAILTLTAASIQNSCFGKKRHEHIPTAAQVVSWAARTHMNVILEVKPDPRWTVEVFQGLNRIIERHQMVDHVVLMSYEASLLHNAEQANPQLATDWILDEAWPGASALIANGTDVVNVGADDLTQGRVRQLHAAGMRVFGRMTNSVTDWQRLKWAGVDGLLTDATSRYLTWYRSHATNAVRAAGSASKAAGRQR
jgi:glycerophosphoryl diester phosphodiesterase